MTALKFYLGVWLSSFLVVLLIHPGSSIVSGGKHVVYSMILSGLLTLIFWCFR